MINTYSGEFATFEHDRSIWRALQLQAKENGSLME